VARKTCSRKKWNFKLKAGFRVVAARGFYVRRVVHIMIGVNLTYAIFLKSSSEGLRLNSTKFRTHLDIHTIAKAEDQQYRLTPPHCSQKGDYLVSVLETETIWSSSRHRARRRPTIR